MTNLEEKLEAIEQLKKIRTIHNGNYAPDIDLAIKSLYYKPITIKETDAEPMTFKALVDERTDEVYIRKFTLDYWKEVKRCEVIEDVY